MDLGFGSDSFRQYLRNMLRKLQREKVRYSGGIHDGSSFPRVCGDSEILGLLVWSHGCQRTASAFVLSQKRVRYRLKFICYLEVIGTSNGGRQQ
jgi:hypothetical protein